jgi:toxin YoeB
MRIVFTEIAWEDFSYWIEVNPPLVQRIKELIADIIKNPFTGIGKPEPLKFGLKGFWSRRITDEHRLVYKVSGTKGVDQVCTIVQCRFHY